eukprot:1447843-Rhodomonas_salina.1
MMLVLKVPRAVTNSKEQRPPFAPSACSFGLSPAVSIHSFLVVYNSAIVKTGNVTASPGEGVWDQDVASPCAEEMRLFESGASDCAHLLHCRQPRGLVFASDDVIVIWIFSPEQDYSFRSSFRCSDGLRANGAPCVMQQTFGCSGTDGANICPTSTNAQQLVTLFLLHEQASSSIPTAFLGQPRGKGPVRIPIHASYSLSNARF